VLIQSRLPDTELLERLRADPVGTAPVVYARFAPVVMRVARRMLGADPERDDIVQQVFARIFRKVAQVREPASVDSWVRAVAANAVCNHLRNRRVRRRRAEHYETATDGDLVRHVETRDLLLRLDAAVERLPPDDRILFLQHYVEGWTLAELAELTGCSLATVKRKVRRANERLELVLTKNRELLRLVRGK
jgi:RNA polymerase sigma-70 factor (ECF subfamily)